MQNGALGLQPCPEKIDRIDNTRTESARKCTDTSCGERTRESILFMDTEESCLSAGDRLFEKLEGSKVDCRVRKHADEAHGQATVRGSECALSNHLFGRSYDERIAVKTAFDCFTLHSDVCEPLQKVTTYVGSCLPKLECIEGINEEPALTI